MRCSYCEKEIERHAETIFKLCVMCKALLDKNIIQRCSTCGDVYKRYLHKSQGLYCRSCRDRKCKICGVSIKGREYCYEHRRQNIPSGDRWKKGNADIEAWIEEAKREGTYMQTLRG